MSLSCGLSPANSYPRVSSEKRDHQSQSGVCHQGRNVKLINASEAAKSAKGEREAGDLEPVSVVCSASPKIRQEVEERSQDCATCETDRKSFGDVHVTERPKGSNK
jgi:hypothetical protein